MNKIHLYQKCSNELDERINRIKDSLNEAQEAANNETKSSAGDKHETGRAMAQLETEKLSAQLTQLIKLQNALNKINPTVPHQTVGLGSLVNTNNGLFYLAIPIGNIKVDGKDVIVISTSSPIASMIISKKVGDSFSFNGTGYEIISID